MWTRTTPSFSDGYGRTHHKECTIVRSRGKSRLIYARHGETDRLRRIRDDRELSAVILGF